MTNKLKYFIGNWKMFGDFSSLKIINKINQFSVKFSKKFKKNRIILCVPNTLINYFATKLKSNHILIGGQNCHYNKFYNTDKYHYVPQENQHDKCFKQTFNRVSYMKPSK